MDPWTPPALDRGSRVPLYYQLQELLHQQIASNRLAVGDALPSETELAEMFGVSRMVVRQALEVLEDDGEIRRMQGKGTFVSEPKLDLAAGGLVRMLSAGADAGVEILGAQPAPVDESVASRLGSGTVLRADWLLRVRGNATAIAYSFLRSATIPALDDGSLRTPKLARGLRLAAPEVSVSTSQCSPYNAELLGIPARAPVFLVDVTEISEPDGEAVEVARVVYRSDTLSLRLETTTRKGVEQIAARISGVTRD